MLCAPAGRQRPVARGRGSMSDGGLCPLRQLPGSPSTTPEPPQSCSAEGPFCAQGHTGQRDSSSTGSASVPEPQGSGNYQNVSKAQRTNASRQHPLTCPEGQRTGHTVASTLWQTVPYSAENVELDAGQINHLGGNWGDPRNRGAGLGCPQICTRPPLCADEPECGAVSLLGFRHPNTGGHCP